MKYLYSRIPAALPHLTTTNTAPEVDVWSTHVHRLPRVAAKEGGLIKSSFLKFLLTQPAKREPVVLTVVLH